jgi:hypothetical protein
MQGHPPLADSACDLPDGLGQGGADPASLRVTHASFGPPRGTNQAHRAVEPVLRVVAEMRPANARQRRVNADTVDFPAAMSRCLFVPSDRQHRTNLPRRDGCDRRQSQRVHTVADADVAILQCRRRGDGVANESAPSWRCCAREQELCGWQWEMRSAWLSNGSSQEGETPAYGVDVRLM